MLDIKQIHNDFVIRYRRNRASQPMTYLSQATILCLVFKSVGGPFHRLLHLHEPCDPIQFVAIR